MLGVFWQRANYQGALAGMLTGFGVCLYYMLHTSTMLGGNASGQGSTSRPSRPVSSACRPPGRRHLVSWLTPAPGRRSRGWLSISGAGMKTHQGLDDVEKSRQNYRKRQRSGKKE